MSGRRLFSFQYRSVVIYSKEAINMIASPKNGVIAPFGDKAAGAMDEVVLTDCVTQFGPHDKSTCCAALE